MSAKTLTAAFLILVLSAGYLSRVSTCLRQLDHSCSMAGEADFDPDELREHSARILGAMLRISSGGRCSGVQVEEFAHEFARRHGHDHAWVQKFLKGFQERGIRQNIKEETD